MLNRNKFINFTYSINMNDTHFDWLNSLPENEKEDYFKKHEQYCKEHYDKWKSLKFIPIPSEIKNEESNKDILSIIQ